MGLPASEAESPQQLGKVDRPVREALKLVLYGLFLAQLAASQSVSRLLIQFSIFRNESSHVFVVWWRLSVRIPCS